ncbi:MAG TPA: hypothetical protein VML75_08975 [Kofleriaceae bacterium]|nr:hypothetical protein [Kofleriaceae bacterium]
MRSHHRLAATCALLFVAACGTQSQRATTTPVAQSGPLDQSLFAKDPRGVMSEEAIQAILRRPLEIELPARVGVLPITPARDWQGPGPADDNAPPAAARFASELRGGELFTMVTEMISIPSGALGMEALRAIAARYKLRYMVLYRENLTRKRKTNAWTIGYLTVVGALFLPGDTLEIDGYVEASMFDIKTGLLMFTVRKRVRASDKDNPWHTDDKLAQMKDRLALAAASELATELRSGIHAFEAAVAAEQSKPAPDQPPAAAPTAEFAPAPSRAPVPADNVP